MRLCSRMPFRQMVCSSSFFCLTAPAIHSLPDRCASMKPIFCISFSPMMSCSPTPAVLAPCRSTSSASYSSRSSRQMALTSSLSAASISWAGCASCCIINIMRSNSSGDGSEGEIELHAIGEAVDPSELVHVHPEDVAAVFLQRVLDGEAEVSFEVGLHTDARVRGGDATVVPGHCRVGQFLLEEVAGELRREGGTSRPSFVLSVSFSTAQKERVSRNVRGLTRSYFLLPFPLDLRQKLVLLCFQASWAAEWFHCWPVRSKELTRPRLHLGWLQVVLLQRLRESPWLYLSLQLKSRSLFWVSRPSLYMRLPKLRLPCTLAQRLKRQSFWVRTPLSQCSLKPSFLIRPQRVRGPRKGNQSLSSSAEVILPSFWVSVSLSAMEEEAALRVALSVKSLSCTQSSSKMDTSPFSSAVHGSVLKELALAINKIKKQYLPPIKITHIPLPESMNVRAQLQEDSIRTIDYNCYLEGFHPYSKPFTGRDYDKAKTQATSRPITANQMRPRCSQKTDYIEDLIKRKTLLNIQYEALKGQPKFQTFLMGFNPEIKNSQKLSFSPLQSPKCKQQHQLKECKSARIFNTLGIRRNRSAMRSRERNSPQQYVKSPLFDRQYHQLNQFPTRKSILKLKIQKNQQKQCRQPSHTKSEGLLKVRLLISWQKETKKVKHQISKRHIVVPPSNRDSQLERMMHVQKMTIHH